MQPTLTKDLVKSGICRSRLRTARLTAQTLHRQLRRKGEDKEAEQKKLYQKLIETAEHIVRQTSKVVMALSQHAEASARQLAQQAQQFLPLIERVINQTRRRVLENQKVASRHKTIDVLVI